MQKLMTLGEPQVEEDWRRVKTDVYEYRDKRKEQVYAKFCPFREALIQAEASAKGLAPEIVKVVVVRESRRACCMHMKSVGPYTLLQRAKEQYTPARQQKSQVGAKPTLKFVLTNADLLHFVSKVVEYHYRLQMDAGIVLRDASANNVVVSADDTTVTLIDFGTADWVDDLLHPDMDGSNERLVFIRRILGDLSNFAKRRVRGYEDFLMAWASDEGFIELQSGIRTRSRHYN